MRTARALSRALAFAFAASAAAACAGVDAPTAPIAPAGSAAGARGVPTTVTTGNDTTVTVFTVDPSRRTAYALGGEHWIVFPAGSICDPTLSTYGPTEWDQPCAALARPIEITARATHDAQGNPRIDFSPALRFRASKAHAVTLYVYDPRPEAAGLSILYCPDDGPCIDESVTDPTLATQYERQGKLLYREITHFSIYNVGVGFSSWD
jgi:hypothetical protein